MDGTGALTLNIYMGTNGSTSDTVIGTLTLPASTAALDIMSADVQVTFTAVGAGSASVFWSVTFLHQAASAAGFGVTIGTTYSGTTGSLNSTTASLIFGLGINVAAGGTMPTVTVPTVFADATNLD